MRVTKQFYHKKIQKGTKTGSAIRSEEGLFYHKKIQKGTKGYAIGRNID